jgi:hypothetical protein
MASFAGTTLVSSYGKQKQPKTQKWSGLAAAGRFKIQASLYSTAPQGSKIMNWQYAESVRNNSMIRAFRLALGGVRHTHRLRAR